MKRAGIVFVILMVTGLLGSASALAAPPGDVSPSPPGQVDRGVVEDITLQLRDEIDYVCAKGPFDHLYYRVTEECPRNLPYKTELPRLDPVEVCISESTGFIRFPHAPECLRGYYSYTIPDDGPLGICVNAFNPIIRVVESEADCLDPFKWWEFYEEIG